MFNALYIYYINIINNNFVLPIILILLKYLNSSKIVLFINNNHIMYDYYQYIIKPMRTHTP